jgi:hypothetical protein
MAAQISQWSRGGGKSSAAIFSSSGRLTSVRPTNFQAMRMLALALAGKV